MKKEINKMITELYKYSELEGCEHGDYWAALASLREFCWDDEGSKEFVVAVEKEMRLQLDEIEKDWEIQEEKVEVRRVSKKYLVYIGDDQ